MRCAYIALLRLYPYDYRSRFAGEMLAAFDEVAGERRVAELVGLIVGASVEWLHKLKSDRTRRARTLPDLRMMRPVGVTREEYFAGPR
jgi:hypothetical protein